jgi:secreted trypsin-like serine protease
VLATGVVMFLVATIGSPGAGAFAGGRQTPVGTYPWTVSIAPSGCTGALISPTWVLTAAHCRVSNGVPVVRVGSWMVDSGGTEIAVAEQVAHPDFVIPPGNPTFAGNDIMLLRLATPADAPTLPLGRQDQAASWGTDRTNAFAGFGVSCGQFVFGDPSCDDVDELAMHDGALTVLDPATCAADYPADVFDPTIMLCAQGSTVGVSPCFGDSGGSLLATTDEGIVSAGVISGGGDPCGAPHTPAVFTRVSAYLGWIASVSGVEPPPAPEPPTTTTTSTTTATTAGSGAPATPTVASPAFAG